MQSLLNIIAPKGIIALPAPAFGDFDAMPASIAALAFDITENMGASFTNGKVYTVADMVNILVNDWPKVDKCGNYPADFTFTQGDAMACIMLGLAQGWLKAY